MENLVIVLLDSKCFKVLRTPAFGASLKASLNNCIHETYAVTGQTGLCFRTSCACFVLPFYWKVYVYHAIQAHTLSLSLFASRGCDPSQVVAALKGDAEAAALCGEHFQSAP